MFKENHIYGICLRYFMYFIVVCCFIFGLSRIKQTNLLPHQQQKKTKMQIKHNLNNTFIVNLLFYAIILSVFSTIFRNFQQLC